MPSWTKEQNEAINKDGTNIIVSAGAGSGKTAVLSERVLTKLKQGVNVNELLILTFTNEAANEMKQRIRKKIEETPTLKKQLDYLDSSYITTFDSFALSIVKKYHYLLNISKEIINIDQTIINIKSNKFLDEIFEDLYKEENELFENLVTEFCFKDDKELKELILDLSEKLQLKLDKKEYLTNYVNNYYNDKNIEELINEYQLILKEKIKDIEKLLNELLIYAEGKYYEKTLFELTPLLNSTTYEEIKTNSDKTMSRMYNNAEDIVKNIKDEINKILKELKELTNYQNLIEIKDSIYKTKNNIEIIIKIINELDQKILKYKEKNNAFSFNDIAQMSIKVVKENEEIRKELKNNFKEIMIDEYQDTSDIQEEFISLIENNNVYMVGDIKQSIYRFRNANPNIFKEKYKNYSDEKNGIKIDLLKNFRSRKEVLEDINKVFNLIMDEALGGAEYSKTHKMVFGNNNYEEIGKTNQNNTLEILNYKYEDRKYTKEEIEVFTIAKDIKEKIENKYQVFDKDTNILRNITYSDFCIIMDRGSEFDKYKKILEYLKIPTSIYQDEKLTSEDDIIILKNILGLILKISKKEYDVDFKYYFTSIARSYLFRLSDEDIFLCFKNNNFFTNDIYIIAKQIAKEINKLDNKNLIIKIINDFEFYEKTITVGSINSSIIRLDNIITISETLSSLGFTKEEMFDYIDSIIKSKYDIKYMVKETGTNSVKIMNIHKSKGLEFPICYFSGYHKEFNMKDVSKKIIHDNQYGIILPYYENNKQKETIVKGLLKNKYQKEEIAEKIRLLYVAMTRAKEKMIIVTSLKENENNTKEEILPVKQRLKYKSFLDIFNSISNHLTNYIIDVDINNLNIDKNYNEIKEKNYKEYIETNNILIEDKELPKDNEFKEKNKFSKTINEIITKQEYENIEYGKNIHKELEQNNNYFIEKIGKTFDINNCNIYKEYEFIYEEEKNEYHGIIDLILEYNDHIKIIDYKLKNIEDDNYKKQLKGYKKYIENLTKKPVKIYLYSISEENIKEII